ncbi:Ldh family oxidoreductase [Pelagibacterium sediminicola]|uniref:Ldh family oxidoreductase n=1 Tax=Pelagibacterium sediminicola TaxID=2248761 RepID=UPI000E318C0F|nr:Ldh family oxidoreductase [Pelagibacterium sediminicola]
MTDMVSLTLDEVQALAVRVLTANGLSEAHAQANATVMRDCQRDECHSHGLYRLIMCVKTLRAGKVVPDAVPEVFDHAPGVVRVDAKSGFSLLALEAGLPMFIEKAKASGTAALAINNCFHFSALWPEVERLAEEGLAALAMNPSHAWVAPAGGNAPLFGTNPLAFAWPRAEGHPFVFDFATSAMARGDIELYRRAGKPLPENTGVDRQGSPTTDAAAVLDGAMLPFGGHKGSALSLMIELLAGPLIGDLTSVESMAFDEGAEATPFHGELLIAFDPARFAGGDAASHLARADALLNAIVGQGARLPGERRHAARERTFASGHVEIPRKLYEDIEALMP